MAVGNIQIAWTVNLVTVIERSKLCSADIREHVCLVPTPAIITYLSHLYVVFSVNKNAFKK